MNERRSGEYRAGSLNIKRAMNQYLSSNCKTNADRLEYNKDKSDVVDDLIPRSASSINLVKTDKERSAAYPSPLHQNIHHCGVSFHSDKQIERYYTRARSFRRLHEREGLMVRYLPSC